MKNQLSVILIFILSAYSYSQISFQKGYYINNEGDIIECEIKNIDWLNNPTTFEYRLSENAEIQKTTIQSVKEFGVYNASKYVRNTVDIDRSTSSINKLSKDKNAIFKEEELFLKVLIEGKSSLYQFTDGNLIRFFFQKDGSDDIEPLVFKNYITSDDFVGENNLFRQQLLNDLKCENIRAGDVRSLSYSKKPLMRLFTKYNQCSNSEIINFENKHKKDLFNLTIRPRLNSSSLTIGNSLIRVNPVTNFRNITNLGLGLEAEFILGFNKNKWSIIVEPSYQSYKSAAEEDSRNVAIDYKSIQLAVGVRHYFFLNDNAKVFINGSLLSDFASNTLIDFDPGADLEITSGQNYGLGLGYKQNDKFSVEFRYERPRNILGTYRTWYSKYKTVSVILGYSIF